METKIADQLGVALVVATHGPAVVQRLSTRWSVHDGTVTATTSVDRSEAPA